jgi:hypothetical protein
VNRLAIILAAIVPAQIIAASRPPQIEELAAAAGRALRGLPGFDKTQGIELSDHLPEQRFSASCRGLAFVRTSASSFLKAEGFDDAIADLAFPQNSAVFLKPSTPGPAIEKIVLYFSVTKSPYVECQYVTGAFAADVGRSKALGEDLHTEAGAVANRVLDRLRGRLNEAPTTAQAQIGIDALRRYAVTDPVLNAARNRAQHLLPEIAPPSIKNVELLVVDLPPDAPASLRLLQTRTCTGAYRAFPVPVVICAGDFLRGVEAAVRRFEDANDLIRSEAKFLAFARSVETDAPGVLEKLRLEDHDKPDRENHIVAHLNVALLFFSGHELGHLMQAAEGRSYDRGSPADDPDREIRASVVNLCKQADALGGKEDDGPFWSKRVSQIESEYRQQLGELQAVRDRSWALEVEADQVGTDLSLKYLDNAGRNGEASLLEQQHLLIETVFVVGLVSWYRDLAVFMDTSCDSMTNSVMLNLCFASKREGFAAAGRLFGDVHRHLLLRSLQLIRAVITRRKALYENSFLPGTKITSAEDLRRADPVLAQREIWRLGDVQRYTMLAALMDTPLKLAYAGCAAGWYAELKARNGPQLRMFDFYRIEDELARISGSDSAPRTGKYDSWFAQVLRLTGPAPGPLPGPNKLFRVNSERGTEDLTGAKLSYSFTFSCDYKARDSSPEPRECFDGLLDEWLQYLSSRKMNTVLVTDASEPGWTRKLYTVTEAGVERFRFSFESEQTGSQSMGYAQIRVANTSERSGPP